MEAETLTATSGTTAWPTTSPATPGRREEASCTVMGDKMFVLGGIFEGEQSSSVEIWDDQVHQWTSGPDMPETRAHFCAVPIDSR